jgi:hypothetical protein
VASVTSPDFPLKPLFMQSLAGEDPINYAAYEFRHLVNAMWATPGVIGQASFQVTQADQLGWNIRVGGGQATSGGYYIYLGSGITISLAGLNTNPAATRTHKVFLTVQDKSNSGTGTRYAANVVVAEDTGSGAPTPEATVSILLATVRISPGQSQILNSHINANPRRASDAAVPYDLDSNGRLVSTIASAHTVINASPLRLRYGNGRVWISGTARLKSGAAFTALSYDLWRMPDWAWPTNDKRLLASTTDSSMVCRLYVSAADGMVTATLSSGKTNDPQYLHLDGLSYEIE